MDALSAERYSYPDTTCDRPLRRCVNLSRRQHLRNVLFDMLCTGSLELTADDCS